MLKARKWLFLGTLFALARPAAGDATAGDPPSHPWPALSAAPLVYVLVLDPIGSKTWGERQIQEIRVGARDNVCEDAGPISSFILLALHTQITVAYALETMEAPPETAASPAGPVPPAPAVASPAGLQRAFEAMGFTPQDLVGKPDIPPVAFTVAATLLGILDWGLGLGADVRARVRGTASIRIDPEDREPAPDPDRVKHKKPLPKIQEPRLIFTKKVVRSIYKILLGVAIGVLIWGFVRRTA